MEIDYYEILEISKNSDSETIKKAFRKLALKYHPDRNQGDKDAEEKFKKVNEAYQVLPYLDTLYITGSSFENNVAVSPIFSIPQC